MVEECVVAWKKPIDDDTLRHMANEDAWKAFDNENEWFANDVHNVRLGLAIAGFNP